MYILEFFSIFSFRKKNLNICFRTQQDEHVLKFQPEIYKKLLPYTTFRSSV